MKAMRAPLWWCHTCNVPLREPQCSKCGGRGSEVILTDPGDVRPAFEGDLRFIYEALDYEFSDAGIGNLLGIGSTGVYLNKVPFIDDMKEVIVGGVVVGRLYFDIASMRWRWRLSEASTRILVDYGRISYVVRDGVKPLEIVGQCEVEGEQIPVVNPGGRLIALAVCRKGVYRVQKLFRREPRYPTLSPRPTLKDLAKANEYHIRRLTSVASSKIYSIWEKVRKPLVASYSGGKDSLVSLDICLRAGFEPRLLFNDTGLELPETLRNVEEVSKRYSLVLDYVSSGERFWESLGTFGPPARDYRWCCKVVKLAAIARYYRENYRDGALVIIGQRAYESLSRFRSGYLWRNKWLPSVLNLSPIQQWDQLTEWLYILENKLPYNYLYEEGFDRLGCYLCPAANIAEYCLIEKLHPDLWSRWYSKLTEWQRVVGQPYEWVRYHLWRWLRKDSPGRRRIYSYLGIPEVMEGTPSDRESPLRGSRLGLTVKFTDGSYIVESEGLDLVEPVISQRTTIGLVRTVNKEEGVIVLEGPGKAGAGRVLLSKNKAVVSGKDSEDLAYGIVKLVTRWYKCTACGNCSYWCPNGAIIISQGRPLTDQRRCSSCRVCLEVCPLTSVYVDRVERYKLGHLFRPKKRSETRFVLELYRALAARTMSSRKETSTQYELDGLKFFLELI